MKRSDLLFCANIDVARFKMFRHRGQLPFYDDDVQSAWRDDFTLQDAFFLRVMLDLIGSDGIDGSNPGLTASYAPKVVSNAVTEIRNRQKFDYLAREIWFGVGIFESQNPDDECLRYSRWFAGVLPDIHRWMDLRVNEGQGAAPVRFFLANASRAARFVTERANQLEIELPDEWEFL